jgi:uncharacterized membrane protein YeaQ/YmgE (transglycosylase-associated protein family)
LQEVTICATRHLRKLTTASAILVSAAACKCYEKHRLTGANVVSGIIWIIIVGFVAGIIARFLSPGPNKPSGFILTTVLGIAGAFLATFIGQMVGWYRPDQGAGFIAATIGAFLVLFIWNRLVVHGVLPDPGRQA